MKTVVKSLVAGLVVSVISGCASDVACVPQLPISAQQKLLAYEKLAPNKVFVIAVDANGHYACGYDHGKATLKEAAKVAAEKCDAQREEYDIAGKAYIYAVNDSVVYADMIKASIEREKQADEPKKADKKAQKVAKPEQVAMGVDMDN